MTFTCFSASGRTWRLTERIGCGSEGVVYTVETPEPQSTRTTQVMQPTQGADVPLVAKLIPDPQDPPAYRRRIERLVRQRREPRTVALLSGVPCRLAWPLASVRTRGGAEGYLMADMRGAFRPLTHLLIPAARQELMPLAGWPTALRAAAALARLLAEVHAEGYVVGDLKPDNLWVNGQGETAMADVDSWQFADGRETFPGRMRTPGYTAPERTGPAAAPLAPTCDDFVLAVLVHQLLMSGLHPFTGHPADGSRYLSLDDNMRCGRSRLLDPLSVVLPRSVPPADVLPRGILTLCTAAFGARDPARRPTAAEWARAIEAELTPGKLATCTVNSRHVYTKERPWCPWCDQAERGGDSYPPLPAAEPAGHAAASHASAGHAASGWAAARRTTPGQAI